MAYTEIDKGSTDGTCAFLAAAIDQLFSVRQPKPCTLILHTTLIASYLHVLLHFLQSVGKARRGKGDMSVGIDVFSPDPDTIFHTLTDALKSAVARCATTSFPGKLVAKDTVAAVTVPAGGVISAGTR